MARLHRFNRSLAAKYGVCSLPDASYTYELSELSMTGQTVLNSKRQTIRVWLTTSQFPNIRIWLPDTNAIKEVMIRKAGNSRRCQMCFRLGRFTWHLMDKESGYHWSSDMKYRTFCPNYQTRRSKCAFNTGFITSHCDRLNSKHSSHYRLVTRYYDEILTEATDHIYI